MRILMLAQFYPPMIGGEERHVRNLSIELAARGHDVAVATLGQANVPDFECDQGVRIYRICASMQRVSGLFREKGRRHSPPFPDPEALWALRRIIIQERPEIVHAHNWIVHSFTPLKAWSKAKLVVTLHDCSLVCAKQQFVYHEALCSGTGLIKCLGCASENYGVAKGVPITLANWFWGRVEAQTVDMFLPVSRAIAEANQLSRQRVSYRIIPNFIPNDVATSTADTDPLLAQLPLNNYLLFVGNVGRDKGVEVLLRAYAEMRSRVPLILIGQPEPGFSATFWDAPLSPHTLAAYLTSLSMVRRACLSLPAIGVRCGRLYSVCWMIRCYESAWEPWQNERLSSSRRQRWYHVLSKRIKRFCDHEANSILHQPK